MSRFHAKDGFCFERTATGGVLISLTEPSPFGGEMTVRQTSLDDSSWASVVAHVSARGENADSWRDAMDWHNGQQEQEES